MSLFDDLKKLITDKRTFDTLGKQETFSVKSTHDAIVIRTSLNNTYSIKEDAVNKINDRYHTSTIEEKQMASHFTDPKWEDCPDRITAPYIAKLIDEINK